MARKTLGKNQQKITIKIAKTAAMMIGAKTARNVPAKAIKSSISDNAQFETGSGDIFAPTLKADFTPCDENASPPPTNVAGIEMLGSSCVVAAYATIAPAGTRINV